MGNRLLHYYHAPAENAAKGRIVFLHGWGANSPLWFASCTSFAEEGYELFFVDLPGFGKSAAPGTPFHLQDYADTITQFVKKMEIADPFIIGHSFGGKIAVRIAAEKGIPLRGMVLVDASGLPHTTLVTKTKIGIAKTVKPIMDLPFMRGVRANLMRLAGSDDYTAFPQLRETFVNIIREHVEYDLPKVEVKTLVVWGGDDENPYTPVVDVSVFERLIPNAQAHIIQNAGHYCFLDNPAEFHTTVSEFLQSAYGKN